MSFSVINEPEQITCEMIDFLVDATNSDNYIFDIGEIYDNLLKHCPEVLRESFCEGYELTTTLQVAIAKSREFRQSISEQLEYVRDESESLA